jgi:hypothetical protein
VINKTTEIRIIALWALSESALGGVLHAFRLPFTGLIVGGFAIVFISMLASIEKSKKNILKATLLVLLVKFAISPHTPLTAYLAVTLQGVLGFLFYSIIPSFKTAVILHGIFTQILSSLQRLITITIVFGTSIWEAIDEFASAIANKFNHSWDFEFSLSLLLISLYTSLHLTAGLMFALLGFKIQKLTREDLPEKFTESLRSIELEIPGKKTKKWYRRKLPMMMLTILFTSTFLTYVFPVVDENIFMEIIYMLLRAATVIIIWISVISPILLNLLNRFLNKKSKANKDSIDVILKMIPILKKIVLISYEEAKKYPGWFTRVKKSILLTFTAALIIDFPENQ